MMLRPKRQKQKNKHYLSELSPKVVNLMPKKIPLRRCLGCMEMKPKNELVRVVKDKEGNIFLDLTGKAPGRGAYICKSTECFSKAGKAKRFEREFSMKIPDEILEKLEAELKKDEE